MVPIAVVIHLPTTHPTMSLTTNIASSSCSATSRDTASLNFGVYQQTAIDSSDISIRTLVPDTISAEPYRKALIANFFSVREYPFLIDLPSPSAILCRLLRHISAWEAEATSISIHNAFFLV